MKKILKFYIFFLFLVLLTRFSFYQNKNKFQIHFLDVGQGDATLITTPTNCKILVDGGKPSTVTDILINHLSFHNRQFDLVIATHADLDHYGGLIKLSQNFTIKHLVLSSDSKTNKQYESFLDLNINTPKIYPTQISKYYICGLYLDLLSFQGRDSNTSSVIAILTLPDQTKVFLGGDIEVEQEKLINDLFPNLRVEILKANHHGSKTSNSFDFMANLSPDYFIISAGRNNSYNHPHSSVIQSAKKLGLNIRRTDLEGTVSFFFD